MWSVTIPRYVALFKRFFCCQAPKCVPIKYYPHHYTTTSTIILAVVTGWLHTFILRRPYSGLTIRISQQRSTLNRTLIISFQYSNAQPLSFLSELQFQFLALLACNRTGNQPGSSAAVAHLLLGSTCCKFREVLRYISVVKRDYLSYACISIKLKQLGHSLPKSFMYKGITSH